MDINGGVQVGFLTALGAAAGAGTGLLLAEITGAKQSAGIAMWFGGFGALAGAFFGGTMVAPTPSAATAALPPATAPTPPAGG